jgi:hypothetical protein
VIDDGEFEDYGLVADIAARKYEVDCFENRIIPETLGIYRLRSNHFFRGFFRAAREEYNKHDIMVEEFMVGIFDHSDDEPTEPEPTGPKLKVVK